MAPERITGQSYTITSDVWSLGVTLLEVGQHRFPFPADGTEMQPRAGLIDLLTYIVRQPIPKLKDEPEHQIKWSENFKYFIECWYISRSFFRYRPELTALQLGERTVEKSYAMAYARASVDGGHEDQESQHGALPEAGLGLERLKHVSQDSCSSTPHRPRPMLFIRQESTE